MTARYGLPPKLGQFWKPGHRPGGDFRTINGTTGPGGAGIRSRPRLFAVRQGHPCASKWVFGHQRPASPAFFILPDENNRPPGSPPDYAQSLQLSRGAGHRGRRALANSPALSPSRMAPDPSRPWCSWPDPVLRTRTKPSAPISRSRISPGLGQQEHRCPPLHQAHIGVCEAASGHEAAFTVNQETVDGCAGRLWLRWRSDGIDSSRIVVLGHSLGAMMAPRIAEGDAQVAGLIILAGPTRPFGQVLVDQVRYIVGLQGNHHPRGAEADRRGRAVGQGNRKARLWPRTRASTSWVP